MKKLVRLFVAVALLGTSPVFALDMQAMKLAGIDFAPASFHKGGKLEGFAVEMLRAIEKRANLDLIEILIQTEKLTPINAEQLAVFPVVIRNPAREKEGFKWIGKVHSDHYCFFTLTSEKLVTSAQQAAALSSIGVVKGGSTERVAQALELKNLEYAMGNSGNVRKLFARKIDAWFTGAMTGRYSVQQEGFDPKSVRCSGNFGSVEIWIAASKSTPEDVVEKLKTSFEALEKDGTLAVLKKKFMAD